jgi:transcription elongation factor Elf1
VGGRKKRRKLILKPRPKIPKMFECPRCGKVAVTVEIKNGVASVKCGSCGLSDEFEVPPIFDAANAYAKFLDRYLEGKIEISKRVTTDSSEAEGESGSLPEELNE